MSDTKFTLDASQALSQLDLLERRMESIESSIRSAGAAQKSAFDRGSVLGVADAVNELQKEYDELKRAAATVKKALDNATDPRAIQTYTDTLAKAERGLEELERAGKKAGVQLKNTNTQMSTGREVAESFFGSFTKASLITAAIGIAVKFGKAALDMAKNTERAQKQFEALTGDAGKAEDIVGRLQKFADKNFLPVDKINEAGKSLLAFGEDSDNLEATLERIGNISKATGKDFNELTTIYGKARAAGVLYAEDINQLVDAGIPIIQQFSDQMGIGADEVKKFASEGKISFSELELALAELTAEGGKFANQIGGDADELDEKWAKFLSNFNNTRTRPIGEFLNSMGKYLLDALNYLSEFEQKIFRFFGLIDDVKAEGPKTIQEAFGFGTAEQQQESLLFLSEQEKTLKALRDKATNDRIAAEKKANETRSKAAAAALKRAQEEELRLLEAQKQFEKDKQEFLISQMEEGLEKELALIEFRYNELREDYEKFGADKSKLIDQQSNAEIDAIANFITAQTQAQNDAAEAQRAANERIIQSQVDALEKKKALREQEIDIAEERSKQLIDVARRNGASQEEINQLEQSLDAEFKLARLDSEIQFQESLLAITDEADADRIQAIKNKITLLKEQIANAGISDAQQTKRRGILELLGLNLDEEDERLVLDSARRIIDSIQQVTEARRIAAEEELRIAEGRVSQAQSDLDYELRLNEQGFASNVDLKRRELAEAKKTQELAAANKRKAAREQLIIDSAVQASSIATSATQLIQSWSSLPFGVGLIAAFAQIAGLIAFIASTKTKARAISRARYGKKGFINNDGIVEGRTHGQGGEILEVERGELVQVGQDGSRKRLQVVRRENVREHFDLLDAVNRNDKEAIAQYALKMSGAKSGGLSGSIKMNTSAVSDNFDKPGASLTINAPTTDTKKLEALVSRVIERMDRSDHSAKWSTDGKTKRRGNVITKYI